MIRSHKERCEHLLQSMDVNALVGNRMLESRDFVRLMAGLRAAEPWAAEELCRAYAPILRAIVRRRLHPDLRTHFDSLDFVQDVWASFLAVPRERFNFDTSDALRQFLTQVALNKVGETYRQRFCTEKRNIRREVPLEQTTPCGCRSDLVSADPTPSWVAIAAEEWEQLLNRFPAGHRAVLVRLREGWTHDEIAEMTGVSRSTIKRIIRRLKELAEA